MKFSAFPEGRGARTDGLLEPDERQGQDATRGPVVTGLQVGWYELPEPGRLAVLHY
jgi:hypothetical protein